MSSLARVAGFLVMMGGLPVLTVAAQDRRMLTARITTAAAEASRRKAAHLDLLRSVQRAKIMSDTFLIGRGGLRLVAQREIAQVAKAAAARVDSTVSQVPSILPVLSGWELTVEIDSSGRYNQEAKRVAIVRYQAKGWKEMFITVSPVDADSIARNIEEQAVQKILQRRAVPFARWYLGLLPLRASDLERKPDWSTVRFDMLSSRSFLGKRCYKGELNACSMLLGLTTADDPVMAWYDSLARFDEVTASKLDAIRFNKPDTEKCLAGDDAACGRALTTIKHYTLPPVGASAREPLVREALLMGGPGALDRLLTSNGSPSEALAAAAGAPIDSVLRRWQRNVHDSSIGSEDLSMKIVLMTLGWIAVLLALVSRISRWR